MHKHCFIDRMKNLTKLQKLYMLVNKGSFFMPLCYAEGIGGPTLSQLVT